MRIRNYGFKIAYKIFIFTILVSFIPMISLSAIFYTKMGQTLKDEVIASYDHVSEQYVSNIEYKLGLYENVIGEVSSNALVQDFLIFLQQYNEPWEITHARATILEDVNKYLSDKLIPSLNGITLYPLDNRVILYHGHLGNVKNLDNYKWIKTILDDGQTNHFYSYTDWGKRNIISFYNIIKDNNKYATSGSRLGLVRLDTFASNLFVLPSASTLKENIHIAILDEHGNKLYSKGQLDIWDNKKETIRKALYNKEEYVQINDERYLIINKEIAKYGWSALLLFDYSSISKEIKDGTASIIIINLILYIILFIVCIIFSASMSGRLKILTDKMQKVKSGVLVTQPNVKGNDEIARIDKDFNDMVVKLSNLINENYIQNIEKKEAELRALRFQINPHFLYNTLELINSMASVYDCDDIGIVSQKLGQMFRYNISNSDSDFTTLSEEIEHIQNYYSIERMRFEDNVKVSIDVPDGLLSCKIPRFILQPLVENAFRYGFKDKKFEGMIKIGAHIMGQHLYVVVEDDGEGIEEERLAFIKSYINNEEINMNEHIDAKNARKGIGLYNVSNRIKLCYGDEYGLQIESKEGAGTRVIICIPNI